MHNICISPRIIAYIAYAHVQRSYLPLLLLYPVHDIVLRQWTSVTKITTIWNLPGDVIVKEYAIDIRNIVTEMKHR